MREGNSKQGPISPISGDENQASNNKHSAHSREEIDISSSWNSPSTGPADARSRFRTSMIVPALDPTMTVVILARATYDWATNQRKNVTNDHFPSKLTGTLINKKRRWREPEGWKECNHSGSYYEVKGKEKKKANPLVQESKHTQV